MVISYDFSATTKSKYVLAENLSYMKILAECNVNMTECIGIGNQIVFVTLK